MLLSRESSIREIIRHICINQEKFTFIFSSLLEESDYINLLKSLCKSSPPKIFTTTKNYPSEIYFQYSANILLNRENIEEGIDLQSYYIYELKKLNKIWSGELFQALSNPSSQITLTRLSFCLNFLLKKKMPLFRSMKYLFWEILHRFQNSDLIKSFGMTIFEMDDQIDIDLLSSFDLIKNITNQNISSFLQIPAVLTTDKSSKLIQSLLSCSEPFPGYSKIFKESNLLTLVNDSIVKRSHFIENILKVGLSYNCNLSKLISLTESCCCSEFLPFYFILSDGQITEQPIEELSKLDDSHAFHIFKRIFGDRQITEFFRTNLGTFVPIEKLAKESFVILMRPILFENVDIDSIIYLSNQYFYTICDNDRDNDFDFYFGLRVISLMLNNNYIFKNKENNNDYFNNYHRIREIKLLLSHINSKKVIIEIFSALFVKDKKTGKFVCPFDVAEAVINYISSSFSTTENESKNKEDKNNENKEDKISNKDDKNSENKNDKNSNKDKKNDENKDDKNSENKDGESFDADEIGSKNNDDVNVVHHFKSENDYDRICADVFARALIHLKLGKLLIITKTRRKKNTELISSKNSSSTSTSIEPCLMTPADIISQLLTRGEFDKASDAANDIAFKLPRLGSICEIARAIQNTKTFNYSPILSIESRKIFNIEYCISNNVDSDYVLENCLTENDNNEIKEIIIKRKEKDLKEIFSPLRKLPSLLTTNQIVSNGKLNLDKIEQNLDEINKDLSQNLNHHKNSQLTKFLTFIKNFEGKIEIFEVEELIDSLIDNVNSWNEIEENLGENCLVGILPIIENLVNKEKFIHLVDQKSHTISTSLRSILKIQPESESENNNKILMNFYLENTNKMKFKYEDLLQHKKEIKTKDIFDIIYQDINIQKKEIKNININDNENLFQIQIDNIDEFNRVRNSIDSILKSSNFDENEKEKINQLIDFRLMNDDLYIFSCIGFIMNHLSFHDFLDVFPEFRTIEFESIKSEKSNPSVVLDELINEDKVSTAIDFSSTFNSRELLVTKLVQKVEKLKQINEKNVAVFLKLWNELSSEIFERLPKKMYININSQIDLLRNENTAVNDKHPELPVLEQYPYLNFDNDLLRIFDTKIKKGIDEGEFYVNYFNEEEEEDNDDDDSYSYFYHYTSINKNYIFNVIDEYANLYLPHFKHYNVIVQKLGSILFNIVNSIVVRSNKGELIAIKIIEKVLFLLKSLKLSLIKISNSSLSSQSTNSIPLSHSKGVTTSSNSNSSTGQTTNMMASQSASTPLRRGSISGNNTESDLVSTISFPFEKEIKLIEWLHQFCELTVYNHFNIEYSFSNFQNKMKSDDNNRLQPFPLRFFIIVCDVLDFTDLLQKFSVLWNVDITEINLHRIESCYRLGKFSDAVQMIKNLGQSATIQKEQKEKLREKLQKAVFFDVGDAVLTEKINKVKNYNRDEDIDVELEVEDYLVIRNNFKKIMNLMENVRRSNIDHKRNSSFNNNYNSVGSNSHGIRSSKSIDSITRKRKLNINLLNYDRVVKLEDIMRISDNNVDNYPFFDISVSDELVSVFYSTTEKIRINSATGNFSKAFKIFFNDLPKSHRVVQVVLIEIFFAALNSNKYDDLFAYLNNVKYIKNRKIEKNDEENRYDFNKLLFNDVSKSLRKMKMNIVLCDFLSRLEQFEGIITNMINIIDEDRSWEDFLRHLDILVDTIQKELNKRSTNGNNSNNNIDDEDEIEKKKNGYIYSTNELMVLLSKAGVLNNFTRLCIDQKIDYPSTLKSRPNTHSNPIEKQNLFKIKNLSILKIKNNNADYASLLAAIEDMAVIALYFEKFNLALQIIELSKSQSKKDQSPRNWIQPIDNASPDSFVIDETSFALFKVCDTLVDKMNITKRPLSTYFEKMHQRLDTNSYAILSLALSKVIFGKAVSPRDVPVFIERNIHGLKLQANILIELGLLNDALGIALRTNDSRLIQKLEKQASVYGNLAVKSRCHRFLELNV